MLLTFDKKPKNKEASGTFAGIIQIINKHFWKAFVGPFFAFGYPVVFTLILGTIFNYEMILGATFSIGPLAIACIALPTALFEFKKSTLLKRIGATNIKPINFLLFTASYYFIIMIFSGLWTALISLVIFGSRYFQVGKELYSFTLGVGEDLQKVIVRSPSLKDLFSRIHWPSYIYSFIALTIVSLSVGLFIVSVSKSILTIQGIGSTLLILTMFLSGQVLPLAQIVKVEAMWYLSYLTPFKSPIIQNTMAFQGVTEASQNFLVNSEWVPFENNLYSHAEYTKLLTSLGQYLKVAHLDPQNPLFQPEAFVGDMSTFNDQHHNALEYDKYNIFDVNKVYQTINPLNTAQTANDHFKNILDISIKTNLRTLMDTKSTPAQIDEAQGFLLMFVWETPKSNNPLKVGQVLNQNNQYFQEIKTINSESDFNELHKIWSERILANKFIQKYANAYVQYTPDAIPDSAFIKIGTKAENILNFILPFVWSAVLLGFASKSFRWNTR
ncbi:ABC transporter permease [Ureaplasma miroungigenitalium]|uniref:ABC transporter permease n=1 Tax=Ureaplasma miroungigenitalium TaxID=1042321 RepID=UPI0021E9844D|nr:ABC transporter permease [Ureaplasma miroungigenitalium]MCV3734415.1 ABC transporter permease [Ureaplasma miroungigenitalium]